MPPEQFADLLVNCHDGIRSVQPDVPLISGGLSSGVVEYLQMVGDLSHVNAIGRHPYGSFPDGTREEWEILPGHFSRIDSSIRRYRDAGFDQPVWITEIGTNKVEIQGNIDRIFSRAAATRTAVEAAAFAALQLLGGTSEAYQAEYCRRMMTHLRDQGDALGVQAAFWFSWSDLQVPDKRFGLVREAHVDSRNLAFDAFPG
jgi:hypothetical protein